MKTQIIAYLERVLGPPINLRNVPADRLRGLPAFLAAEYGFLEWEWMNKKLILAHRLQDKNDPPPSTLRDHAKQLSTHFDAWVILAFPDIKAYHRDRLVSMGISFLVPDTQLFVPPFADLSEVYKRVVKAEKISAATQLAILYHILHRPPDGELLNQWAVRLGYSPMTLTKVRDELDGLGLCEREQGAKPRGLRFLFQGKELWEKARPHLRSPIAKTHHAKFQKRPDSFYAAGLTALEKLSNIEDDKLPTYACRESDWKRLIEQRKVRTADHPDEADARIEQWRYKPGLLADQGRVDPLSLYLSLADNNDERVRLAADALLEKFAW